ncbi:MULTISPECIES: hypothetical protein [Microtetraspora]|uniref:Uncharacterized protein n=1 Tax=Microtetraspora glauca TaxID=1996 RepID=A0ABV3G6V9_MICGL|nr:hypothetical protein [Microtetraspora sp. AC03309]
MITEIGGQSRAGDGLFCGESGKGFMAWLTLLYVGAKTATER